jgi:CYTH domain-containing protein
MVISRRPGEGRYAQLEREQRWLLEELPHGVADERKIVDHYLTGTSLRLRMVESSDGVVYKLAQKVRTDVGSPELVKITNIYLDESDFRALAAVPASIVAKSRWTVESDGVSYAVDEFKGRHSGLALAEIEVGPDQPRHEVPDFALVEVTNDDEFSGGSLARASDADLRRIIPRRYEVGGHRGSR